MVKVMAVNAGSSSLKFQLFNMPSEEVITSGVVERIGFEDAIFTIKFNGEKKTVTTAIKDHGVAVSLLLNALVDEGIVKELSEINAVGHRIVQGGKYFDDSAIVTEEVANIVESLCDLAPLHNPAHLVGYRAFKEALPGVEHVFTFDTAFHQTMAPEAYLYALPYEYYEEYAVRRYGAHGTSHKYVSHEVIKELGRPEHSKVIVCHLGNGASLSAVRDGKCVDTSMGFTPLAGVMMGTRSGDIDPSIIPYLCEKLGTDAAGLINILNKKSGMLGVSGISSDSRDVENAYHQGHERSVLTMKLYAHIVAKFIGSYYVELGGCDAIAFTAGLGENASLVRKMVIDLVKDALGCELDETLNNTRGDGNRLISSPESKIKVYVVPTNEEVMIARDTVRLLNLA